MGDVYVLVHNDSSRSSDKVGSHMNFDDSTNKICRRIGRGM